MYSMLGQKEEGEGRSNFFCVCEYACCNFYNQVIQKSLMFESNDCNLSQYLNLFLMKEYLLIAI